GDYLIKDGDLLIVSDKDKKKIPQTIPLLHSNKIFNKISFGSSPVNTSGDKLLHILQKISGFTSQARVETDVIAKSLPKRGPPAERTIAYSLAENSPFSSSPVENSYLPAEHKIRYGLPKEIINTKYPLPHQAIRDNKGNMPAFWAMLFGTAELLLEWSRQGHLPVKLEDVTRKKVEMELLERFGFSNIGDNSGIRIQDIFDYLENLNIIFKNKDGFYELKEKKETIATWARLNFFIEEELRRMFDERGEIKNEEGLAEMINGYSRACEEFPLGPVEARQPFLRGVLGLSAKMRGLLAKYLLRSVNGDLSGYAVERKALTESVLLMLNMIPDLEKWGEEVFKHLQGRRLYLFAPEVSQLKGGLGRVMQYLARALKAMGLDVVIVEPRYLWGSSQERQADKKLDYESLPIPLRMSEEVAFTTGVTVQGRKEEVLVYKTENDEDIPVITFRDKGNWYVQILYLNDNTNAEGSRVCDPASSHFIEFATKAFLAVVNEIEESRRKEAGDEWKAPLLGLNDGQTMVAAAWSLFLLEFQTPVLLEAYYASTTHTVLNRQFTDREYLKRAGVPDEWMWLWKAKIVYGHQGYDWSSAGLRATMLRRGFTNYVSDSHGYQMRQFDPQIYESAGIGLTNGDLVWLTQRYFTMRFMESRFASRVLKDSYCRLKEKQQNEADKFKRAKLQQEMDKLAYKGLCSWVDEAGRTNEELAEMFTELVSACKEYYIETYIKPRVNQWNIALPGEYNGDWGAYFKDMEHMLWSGYSGRWVHEKWGREGAFSDNNVTKGIEQGQLFVILGNVQDYKGTEEPGGSKWEGERFLDLAKRLNSRGLKGKLVYNPRFEIDEQLALLPCLAPQMQDSSFLTQLRNPLITGAAESTEAHTWMHGGCAALHGYIQLIQALANRKACRGSNIVPKDSSERSYLELYEWVLEAGREGKLTHHLLDGFKLFRSVDVNLTAAEYARQWDKMVGKEEMKRQELISANPGKPIHQILLEEFGGFAQPEHEVTFAQDEKNYLQIKQRLDSGKVILDNEPCAGGSRICVISKGVNKLELTVPVRLNGLKRVSAWIETPEGVIEEFSQVEEKPEEDLVIFKKAICANGKEKKFRVIITSGKWRQEHEVTLTPRLSSKVRQEICEQSNHKMKIRIIEEAGYVKQIEEKVWDVVMGHKVKIEITMPLRRYGACSKLAPVILGTTNPVKNVNGERFIAEADIGDYLVENDSAKWTITFTPKGSGWLTAALFERLDMNNGSLRKEDIISWANGWGGDIHINVLAPQEMRAKYLNQECASSPVEKHANSKVVSIHYKEIKRVKGELSLVEKRISETKSFLPDVQAWDKLFYKAELGWLLAQKRNLLRILKELTGKGNPVKFKGSSSPVDAWWQIPNETYVVETMSIAALRRMNNDPGTGKWTDIAPYFKSRLLPNGIRVAVMLPHYPILLESPYGSICQYAVNADYNDWSEVPEVIKHKEEFGPLLTSPSREINHAELRYRESTILQKAFDIFQRECIINNTKRAGQFKEFCANHDNDWLDDFADFIVLHLFFNGRAWWKWDGERVRQARITSHYLELKNRYKYSQWIGYQQLAQALRDVNAMGGYLLFDDAMFRAKDSVDVYRHHKEFFRDIDTRYPGIVNENANERWMDLALWNWDALRKDGYKLKLDPIRHWLDFGFAGGRTDALHFSWNFGSGQLASGDEDGEDFASALVKVYLEGGKLPLAEAYEGKAGDAERLGFVVVDGNAKRLSTHDDHSRWYNRNAVNFMVGFNNLLQAQVSPKSSRFIIYTMGDLWGDDELIKVVRITTSWGETIYATGFDGYTRTLKLKPEEIMLRESLWRYRMPIPSDPDYRLRSRYDLGPFIKFMTRIYPRLQKEVKSIWEDEEAIACIMPTLHAAADSFVKSFNGVPQIWAASRDWFFEQWGRDTFISYTGCLLPQKWLHSEAKALLESFSRLERAGLIPNRIIDPVNPEYNTVDGSMWFVYVMTHKYLDYTGDTETIKQMLPLIRRVMLGYYNGTGYYDRNGQWQGIYADKEDGLIISPAQSTWMDAVPEQTAPVTPRNGKCVEIQGLWYANLRWLAEATEKFNLQPENNEPDWKKLAETVKNNFRSKFWNSNLKNPGKSNERENCLFDVIGPDGTPYSANHGAALRPNQLIALSVAPDLLPMEAQALVSNACQNDLSTPYGPRTLSPRDSNYHPHYDTYCQPRPDSADFSKHKDFAYHQGASWPWLIGPEIDLLVRVKRWQGITEAKIKEEVRFRTEKLLLRLFTHGSIDEVFNGGEPGSAASQYPGGTSSQAWSVAELLRILHEYKACEGGINMVNYQTASSPVESYSFEIDTFYQLTASYFNADYHNKEQLGLVATRLVNLSMYIPEVMLEFFKTEFIQGRHGLDDYLGIYTKVFGKDEQLSPVDRELRDRLFALIVPALISRLNDILISFDLSEKEMKNTLQLINNNFFNDYFKKDDYWRLAVAVLIKVSTLNPGIIIEELKYRDETPKHTLDEYAPKYASVLGWEKARKLIADMVVFANESIRKGKDIEAFVNATFDGGGVSEMFRTGMSIFEELGMTAHWVRVYPSFTGFYNITKSIHNNMQGNDAVIIAEELEQWIATVIVNMYIYRQLFTDSRVASTHIEDSQPLPLITDLPLSAYFKAFELVLGEEAAKKLSSNILSFDAQRNMELRKTWRFHIDIAGITKKNPNAMRVWSKMLEYLTRLTDNDAIMFQPCLVPSGLSIAANVLTQYPGIDPLAEKNQEMTYDEMAELIGQI
ncbi:MAG: 4-alpha-glucanotransferase, partial [Candidatus Omnitrophota bacterium]